MRMAIIILAAFLLDMLFGDPVFLYHPICFIGKMISIGEKFFRAVFPKTTKGELWGGTFMSITVILLCFIVPFLILLGLWFLHPALAFVVELFFCYQIFAAKSLKKESMKVYQPLKNNNLPEARKYLSYIVGRDTQKLTVPEVIRAAVETVAENTSDGVVAPLFYMALGGAPLAFLYKGINTLDSMIGYKNEKYLYFGRFAAKLDDVANFIPARLSGLFMVAAAWFVRYDCKNAMRIFRRDRKKHASPNSAQTESACAGALHIRLAGDAVYFGKLYHKPYIGDDDREVVPEDITAANRLMIMTSVLAVTCAVFVHMAVWCMVYLAG